MQYGEDSLKGLDRETINTINMIAKGLAPYFLEGRRKEAVYTLRGGLALLAKTGDFDLEMSKYGPGITDLRTPERNNGASKLIGAHLACMATTLDSEQLAQKLHEYAQELTQQQKRN